jgi:hypothetical protein
MRVEFNFVAMCALAGLCSCHSSFVCWAILVKCIRDSLAPVSEVLLRREYR